MKLLRIKAIIRKEFLQIARDPLSLAMAFALPVILLFLFGYAISLDVNNITTIVYDRDRSSLSRGFLSDLTASGYFTVVRHAERNTDYLGDSGRVPGRLPSRSSSRGGCPSALLPFPGSDRRGDNLR